MAVGPRLIALALIARMDADERRALVVQVIGESHDFSLAHEAAEAGQARIAELSGPRHRAEPFFVEGADA